MQAGRLTEDIEVLRPTITLNEYGEQETEYTTVDSAKASMEYAGKVGREKENGEIVYHEEYEAVVYNHVNVQDFDKILYNGSTYFVDYVKSDKIHNMKKLKLTRENE